METLIATAEQVHSRKMPASRLLRDAGTSMILSLTSVSSPTRAATKVFKHVFKKEQWQNGIAAIPDSEMDQFLGEYFYLFSQFNLQPF